MNQPSDHTPLPGTVVEPAETENILPRFLAKFRREPDGIPSNLPTACALGGVEKKDAIQSAFFASREQLYFLLENPSRLRIASPESILKFIQTKEPWEDYDICIFDAELSWCVGFTHNEKEILVDRDGNFEKS